MKHFIICLSGLHQATFCPWATAWPKYSHRRACCQCQHDRSCWHHMFPVESPLFGYVSWVWRCFTTNKFDAQGPGGIIIPQTARSESHAFKRYRVLDFDDQSCFLHAELCHGRRERKAILNILDGPRVLGHGLSNARSRI